MFILFSCAFCYSWSVLWPRRDRPQRKCPHAHLRPLSLHLSPTSRRWTGVQNCTESHAVGLLCLCGLVSVIMSKPCKSDFYQLWQQVSLCFHFMRLRARVHVCVSPSVCHHGRMWSWAPSLAITKAWQVFICLSVDGFCQHDGVINMQGTAMKLYRCN